MLLAAAVPLHALRVSSTIGSPSRTQKFFVEQGLRHEKAGGYHGQGDVVVPAAPTAALIVVKAQFVFHLLVVLLDPPPDLGQPHELGKRGIRIEIG